MPGRKGLSNKPPTFGVPIDRESSDVPPIVRHVVEYFDAKGVEIEGLFRLSSSMRLITELVEQYEKGEIIDLMHVEDPHAVTGVLKHYLRELPEPLLTFELYDCFLAAGAVPQSEIETIRKVLTLLPNSHRVILKFLVSFLHRITLKSDVNKMTSSNIGIVFAPNLLQPPGGDLTVQMQDQARSNKLMELFVKEYEAIFKDEPDPDPSNNNQLQQMVIKGHRMRRSMSCGEDIFGPTKTNFFALNEPKPRPTDALTRPQEPFIPITSKPPIPALPPIKKPLPPIPSSPTSAKLTTPLSQLQSHQPRKPPPPLPTYLTSSQPENQTDNQPEKQTDNQTEDQTEIQIKDQTKDQIKPAQSRRAPPTRLCKQRSATSAVRPTPRTEQISKPFSPPTAPHVPSSFSSAKPFHLHNSDKLPLSGKESAPIKSVKDLIPPPQVPKPPQPSESVEAKPPTNITNAQLAKPKPSQLKPVKSTQVPPILQNTEHQNHKLEQRLPPKPKLQPAISMPSSQSIKKPPNQNHQKHQLSKSNPNPNPNPHPHPHPHPHPNSNPNPNSNPHPHPRQMGRAPVPALVKNNSYDGKRTQPTPAGQRANTDENVILRPRFGTATRGRNVHSLSANQTKQLFANPPSTNPPLASPSVIPPQVMPQLASEISRRNRSATTGIPPRNKPS